MGVSPITNPPLPLPGDRSHAEGAAAIWEEFAALIDEARRRSAQYEPADAAGFYRTLLVDLADAVACPSATAWRLTAQRAEPIAHLGAAGQGAPAREALLTAAADEPGKPHRGRLDNRWQAVVLAVRSPDATPLGAETHLVELRFEPHAAPALLDAADRLLAEVAGAATVFETRRVAAQWRDRAGNAELLLAVPPAVSGDLRPEATAMRIADEARRLSGAGRVVVLRRALAGPVVLAVSGVDEVDHRGAAATAWRRLACVRGEHAVDGHEDESHDPVLAEEIDRCRDATHATSVSVAPLRLGARDDLPSVGDDAPAELVGWIIAEHFQEQAEPQGVALAAIATVVAPALHAAVESRRGVGSRFIERVRSSATALTLTGMLAIAAVGALAFMPVEHTVTVRGELRPVVERGVFAPSDATVVRTHVVSGQRVSAGQLLVELTDPESLVRLQELEGRVETLTRQHAAAMALRRTGDRRQTDRVEQLRLSADTQRLATQLEAAVAQRDLLLAERARLRVESSIDGVVTTWRPDESLAGRPVNRGRRLLTVADDRQAWRLELQAPDDRAGLIREAIARRDDGTPLRVTYELAGVEGVSHEGSLSDVAPAATIDADEFGVEHRLVRLNVTPESPLEPTADGRATPGVGVRARVYCGRRPLAYVALHDAWRLFTTWLRL